VSNSPDEISKKITAAFQGSLASEDKEAALQSFKMICDHLPMSISLFRYVDFETLIVMAANTTALRSVRVEQPIGKNMFDLIYPSDIPRVKANLHACIEQHSAITTEAKVERPDNKDLWISNTFKPIDNEHGEVSYILSISQDVTERKKQELALIEQNEIIQRQAAALTELSTPLLEISSSTLVMPLIGSIDTQRIQLLITTLLEGVSEKQADNVIVDITGVPFVDTQVANALIQAARALRLLGAHVILSGIRPEVAQILVSLGMDFSTLTTYSSLKAAIAATD
jgi:rsbT co-antagonist protein RsbR